MAKLREFLNNDGNFLIRMGIAKKGQWAELQPLVDLKRAIAQAKGSKRCPGCRVRISNNKQLCQGCIDTTLRAAVSGPSRPESTHATGLNAGSNRGN